MQRVVGTLFLLPVRIICMQNVTELPMRLIRVNKQNQLRKSP